MRCFTQKAWDQLNENLITDNENLLLNGVAAKCTYSNNKLTITDIASIGYGNGSYEELEKIPEKELNWIPACTIKSMVYEYTTEEKERMDLFLEKCSKI